MACLLAGATTAGAAEDKPAPEGLTCPVDIAGGERISVGDVAPTPGVTGFCIYYLVGETDFEAVTMTLRIADADYDWQASFKAPKIDKGGMQVVQEGTLSAPLGDGNATATVTTLSAEVTGSDFQTSLPVLASRHHTNRSSVFSTARLKPPM